MTELCDNNDTPVLKQNKDVLVKEEKHALRVKFDTVSLYTLVDTAALSAAETSERRKLTNTNCSSISGEMTPAAMSDVLRGK